MKFDRTNTNIVARWWWTIDRLMMAALFALICIGAVLVTAASPPVALRIGLDPFHFIKRQEFFLFLSVLVLFAVSLMTPGQVRRLALFGLIVSLMLMMVLPFTGADVKGAKRWLNIFHMSIQPSEFMKPCLAVVMAWIFSFKIRNVDFPTYKAAIGLYLICVVLLIIQPDFGMTITISAMWALQFFLAGLPLFWVIGLVGFGVLGGVGAYEFFPHVRARIDRFLDPESGDNYQVEKSLEAFRSGGLLGRGPGEGQVKQFLPDSHTDFVFSVAGEEFGTIFCILIVLLFGFVVIRGLVRIWGEKEWFITLAVAGLLAQFGIQAVINMSVAVNLIPAKGMTLPFLSYGGSSLLAVALGMGMVLALTRKRFGK